MSKNKRGVLICLEGVDCSGKTTQAKKLVDYLNNEKKVKTELWRFPNRTTTIGKMIDAYLKADELKELDDRAIHLLFSANRWELYQKMEKTLLEGTSIVLDRYVHSGIAYSMAKGLEEEWCRLCDAGLLAPDVLFYLNASMTLIQKRAGFGQERYENIDFIRKVSDAYDKIQNDEWEIMDASLPIDELHEKIREIALEVVESRSSIGFFIFSHEK